MFALRRYRAVVVNVRRCTFFLFFSCLIGTSTEADLLFPADVEAFGLYRFDSRPSQSFFGPNVEQSGSLYARLDGNDSIERLNYMSGNPGMLMGPNPVGGFLTRHGGGTVGGGDGFGGTARVSANTSMMTGFRADTDLDFDRGPPAPTPLIITNQSVNLSYRVFMSFEYDHEVNTSGPDASVRSDFDVGLDDTRLFNSELISDSEGNVVDEVDLVGQFGGLLQADGVFQFNFLLSPGETREVFLDYTQESRDFSNGQASGEASYFLSIDNITAVPEPGSLALVGFVVLFATQVRSRGQSGLIRGMF
ncbi:MAG: hypothetical protein AAF664_15050 [Planctomycetota bacterium]